MIGHSLPELVFIRTSILGLRLIAPLSIAHVAASLWRGRWIVSRWLGYYAIVEAVFYLCVYLPRSRHLQKEATHPERLAREDREALFAKCFSSTRNASFATGWFFVTSSHIIRRGNVIEWILWALFMSTEDTRLEEWGEEIEGYVLMIETILGRKLEDGYNEDIKCMKVSMDAVVGVHRPFVWYTIVAFVDWCTTLVLLYHGYKHFAPSRWYCHFPVRPLSVFTERSPHPRLSYWYRPHRSTTKHPIVFFHGIGIGLWPYTAFFADIVASDPDVGILAFEDLSVSMRISPPPLRRDELLAALPMILDHHGLDKFVLVGHSYGTVVQAHILRHPPLAARVAGWLFIDPIPFLLHQPAVAYNFVYRTPRTANEWQLWYFASRDPDIARALARYFFWSQNILFREDLLGKDVGVVLSGADQIVDAEEVRAYLTGEAEKKSRWVSSEGGGEGGLEVLWHPTLDHAQVFDTKERRAPVVAIVSRLARAGASAEDIDAPREEVVAAKTVVCNGNGDAYHD